MTAWVEHRQGRRAAILLAALAVFLRILIPSGWMPASDRLGLMPCFGVSSTAAMHAAVGMSHHAAPNRAPHPDSDKGDKPCAYQAFACALAEPEPQSAVAVPILPLALLSAALTGVAIGAGLAAPPPPPTGPPATF